MPPKASFRNSDTSFIPNAYSGTSLAVAYCYEPVKTIWLALSFARGIETEKKVNLPRQRPHPAAPKTFAVPSPKADTFSISAQLLNEWRALRGENRDCFPR